MDEIPSVQGKVGMSIIPSSEGPSGPRNRPNPLEFFFFRLESDLLNVMLKRGLHDVRRGPPLYK